MFVSVLGKCSNYLFCSAGPGLNVICCGDMWQLDPPDGGFVGAIPTEYIKRARKYMPTPTVAHGQALFWAGPVGGFQGCTELEVPEFSVNIVLGMRVRAFIYRMHAASR